jgi:tetratricopeptide (TPR) repeat protein
MPRQGAEDIPHVTVHDHYIRNPSENPVKEIQIEPTNLYAVNNDKPSVRNKIRAYLEYYEKFDKNPVFLKRAEDLLQEEPFADLQMRYHYLISQYKEVISVYNKESPELDHWTAYLLAESYYQLDEIESALAAFRLSDKLLPGHPVIRRRFFLVLVHEKRWDEADKFADYLKKGYPYDARIYAGLASLKMIRGEIEESGKLLEKALMFDPNEVKVWEAYVNFYLQKRQMNDARKWAAKILEHYPNHVNKALLNQILLS